MTSVASSNTRPADETLAERAPRKAAELGPVFLALLDELAAEVTWGPAWRAIQLGSRPEVANALFSGETVPLDRLDPAAVARYGRRPRGN